MEHKTLFIITLSLDLSEFIHSFYLFNCLGRLNIYFVGLNRFIMKNVSIIALNNNGSTASPWLSIVRLVVVGLCVGGGESPHLPCRPTQDPPSHFISPPPPPPPPPPTSRHFEHPPPTGPICSVYFQGGGGGEGRGVAARPLSLICLCLTLYSWTGGNVCMWGGREHFPIHPVSPNQNHTHSQG